MYCLDTVLITDSEDQSDHIHSELVLLRYQVYAFRRPFLFLLGIRAELYFVEKK